MDSISRQAAIDALEKAIRENPYYDSNDRINGLGIYDVRVIINDLPSAQPELSTEDKQLIKKLRSYHNGSYANVIDKLIASAQPYTINSDGRLWITVDDIDKVTAVVVDEQKSKFCKQFYEDAQPERKKGKWIDTGDMDEWWAEVFACSECGWLMLGTANYCPNCGADMRGEQDG